MSADSDILSEDIREKAKLSFVLPALRAGKRDLTISVRDVMREFGTRGKGKQSLICSALKARKFQESNRMKLEMCEGPPSGRGTSTVYHYRFQEAAPLTREQTHGSVTRQEAERLADQYLEPLRGLLSKEIAAFGGGEAFLKWVRAEDSEA